MDQATLSISFPNEERSNAREQALQLRSYLLNREIVSEADVVKDRDDTADLGSIIQIVFAAPAIVAVATVFSQAVADWLRDRNDSEESEAGEETTEELTVEVKRVSAGQTDVVHASGSPSDVKDVLERFLTKSDPNDA